VAAGLETQVPQYEEFLVFALIGDDEAREQLRGR
jgi:hypothetical protein